MSANKPKMEVISIDILEEIFKNRNYEEIIPQIYNENSNMIKFCEKITKFTKKTDDLLDPKKIKKSDIGFDWEVDANGGIQDDSKGDIQNNPKKEQAKFDKTIQSASKSVLQYSISYFIKGLRVFEKFKKNKSDGNHVLSQLELEYTKPLNYNIEKLPSYIYETFFEVDLDTEIDPNINYMIENTFKAEKTQSDILYEISNLTFEKSEYKSIDYKIICPSKKIDMLLQRPEQNEPDDKLRDLNKEIKAFLKKSFAPTKFSYT